MTIRETRKRLIKAMDALIKDGEENVAFVGENKDSKNLLRYDAYLSGLKTAKKAVIKVMDNLEN
jgi:hypothetical protein